MEGGVLNSLGVPPSGGPKPRKRGTPNPELRQCLMERRKAWRMLQSKAGVANKDYQAQKALLAKLDKGEVQLADAQSKTKELFDAELARIN
jgi:hypothetical protein